MCMMHETIGIRFPLKDVGVSALELSVDTMEKIINHLVCGIIIMDQDRKIHYLNDAASLQTGWQVGESVPYCSYCQKREVGEGENRCILSADDPIPYFNSHMAVYVGKKEEFQMSMKKIVINNKQYRMLSIRCPDEYESENDRFQELLIQETMLAQEVERQRIARELHDHIGQNVYSIFLGLEGIKYLINDSAYEKHFTNMMNIMEKTVNDIKRLSKTLRPEITYHFGIREALHEAIRDWENLYQIEVKLVVDLKEEERFNKEKELHLFRVIQEAVQNAVRHGRASKISIKLHLVEQSLFFKIIDNGDGFQTKSHIRSGLGMKHMYERCMMLDGGIKWIRSKCNSFTIVEGFVSIFHNEGEVSSELINC